VKTNIENARVILNGTTGAYLKFKQEAQKRLSEIERDRLLSDEGKRVKREEVQKELRAMLVDVVKELKQMYTSEVASARKQAEAILNRPKPKIDEKTAQQYREELAELKTHLALTPNPARAKQLLDEYFGKIDNAAKAEMVRAEFGTLVQPVLSRLGGDSALQANLQYRTLYDTLKTKFLTDEEREAQRALESVEALERSTLFPDLIYTDVRNLLGVRAMRILDDPDAFVEVEEKQNEGSR
jgi:hypothetical protein